MPIEPKNRLSSARQEQGKVDEPAGNLKGRKISWIRIPKSIAYALADFSNALFKICYGALKFMLSPLIFLFKHKKIDKIPLQDPEVEKTEEIRKEHLGEEVEKAPPTELRQEVKTKPSKTKKSRKENQDQIYKLLCSIDIKNLEAIKQLVEAEENISKLFAADSIGTDKELMQFMRIQAKTEEIRNGIEEFMESMVQGSKDFEKLEKEKENLNDEVNFEEINDLRRAVALSNKLQERIDYLSDLLNYMSVNNEPAEMEERIRRLKAAYEASLESVKNKVQVNLPVLKDMVEKELANMENIENRQLYFNESLRLLNFLKTFERKFSIVEGNLTQGQANFDYVDDLLSQGEFFRGISNIGNSCYLNSAMQALLQVPEFKFSKWSVESTLMKSIPEALFYLVAELSEVIHEWEDKGFTDESFTDSLDNLSKKIQREVTPEEEDAFKVLLDKGKKERALYDAVKEFIAAYNSDARPSDLSAFAKNLRNALFEAEVFYKNEGLDSMQDPAQIWEKFLLNSLQEVELVSDYRPQPSSVLHLFIPPDKPVSSLQELLEVNYKSETSSYLRKPSQYLALQIKRFQMENHKDEMWPVKISTCFDIPEDFTLDFSTAFGEKNIKYRIKAVVTHHAFGKKTLNSGHYTALIDKHGIWFKANDSTISEVENPSKSMGEGYLFLLERVPEELFSV